MVQDQKKRNDKPLGFLGMVKKGNKTLLSAALGLFLGIVKSQLDLAGEIFKADLSMKSGDLKKAESIYKEISQYFGNSGVFREKYAEFLMSRGEYDEIIKRFGEDQEMKGKTTRASECLSILLSSNVRLISTLVKESPYSGPVLRAYIQVCLIDEKLEEAAKFIKKSRVMFPSEPEFIHQEMQLYFLTGMFSAGIKELESLGYKGIASSFKSILDSYERVKKSNLSSKDKYRKLDVLARSISLIESDSNFFPSIFSTLKLNVILELCKNGIESGEKGLTNRAQYLYSKRKSEDAMYLYIMALVFDGKISEAEEKLQEFKFRNTKLKNHIWNQIETAKAEKERERKAKEERRYKKRRYMDGSQRMSRNKGDFLGYYKILGFKENQKPSEKEIKKAYRKMVVANKKRKKTEGEEKEWEENFKKLNKAFGVLTDKKKREMYDGGIDPDNPQQTGGFGEDPFQEIFRGFGDFAGFGFPQERRGRRTTTTYFYF
ncbi:uncharacterized protein Eint_040040 [Encephalitozoon intestinalis ATCC 50506]|uniref:J domain-containing protein n=1 Tax=Encephalitozoon intestinalis (strain ATCC 50506) TaxID=876142 RepID=E0S6G2_ENCIT|nr:uncharacterized protein Eint_040040 [Encephalitozoon intestinalis ATCC 50506]ADM11297.1 hypothetical protein Eint_040040 [Encephalitozoon intestinalis ATCC 50506]